MCHKYYCHSYALQAQSPLASSRLYFVFVASILSSRRRSSSSSRIFLSCCFFNLLLGFRVLSSFYDSGICRACLSGYCRRCFSLPFYLSICISDVLCYQHLCLFFHILPERFSAVSFILCDSPFGHSFFYIASLFLLSVRHLLLYTASSHGSNVAAIRTPASFPMICIVALACLLFL